MIRRPVRRNMSGSLRRHAAIGSGALQPSVLSRWWTAQDLERPVTLPVGRGRTKSALNLRVIVPGVAPEDLQVRRVERTLYVTGVRRPPVGFGETGSCEFGMAYGAIRQTVELPAGLALHMMHMSLHHGVLDIHIPFLGPYVAQHVARIDSPPPPRAFVAENLPVAVAA